MKVNFFGFLSAIMICSLGLCASCAQHAQAATDQNSSESLKVFVQSFYNWYVPRALGDNTSPSWNIALTQKSSMFNQKLADALKKDSIAQVQSPGEIVGLDFDPFLASQDPCERYEVGKVTQKYNSYFIEIFGVCSGKRNTKPDVIAELTWKYTSWKFVNFYYQNNKDLLSVLKSLQEGRIETPKQNSDAHARQNLRPEPRKVPLR